VDNLDSGSLVDADLSIGRHPAIVLSTKEEIAASGLALVVAISKNCTISLPEDRIEVPHRLGMKKKCYVQCDVIEILKANTLISRQRRAWGPFLESVKRQVRIADERKKSTQG
jgi:mRNA-degrading endonuclease toxin of MazEF toxin-antitoxin module